MQNRPKLTAKQERIKTAIRPLVESILKESKFKAVKVTYSNGFHITTDVNPNVSDEEIYRYFKVGSTVNIGMGPDDKLVKITNVEILPTE